VFLAAAVAVTAVALGLLLGLVPGGRGGVLGPLRTFALAAALTVVLTHLLPEAFEELGATAVLLLGLVAAGPAWVRLLMGMFGSRDSHADGHAGLAAGYAGLLVHHVGDGVGLGAYAALPGGPVAHLDVLLALAVHTVPLVAVFAFAFRAVGGARAAVTRSAGLALASVGGVLLSSAVSAELTHSISAWIAAFVAGLLVHVMSHDLERDLPTSASSRSLDLIAGLAGAGVCLLGSDEELVAARSALAEALASDAAQAAAALLLAYLAAVVLARFAGTGLRRWLGAFPQPAFGLDGVLVGAALAGPAFGGLILVGIVLAARLGAGRSLPGTDAREPPALFERFAAAVPWWVTGLLLGALVRAGLPVTAFEALSAPGAIALAALAALPIWLPPAAAVMVAIALWERGLAPQAALIFALLAMTPRPAELIELARRVGPGVAVSRLLSAVLVAVGVGSVNAFVEHAPLRLGGPFGAFAAALLAAGCVAIAWKLGLRALFGAVFHSHDTAAPLSAR
jgi:hypothetical protein